MPLLSTRAAGSARGFGFAGGGEKFLDASGGTVTEDGSYKVHTFSTGGTFTVNQLATDPANDVMQYLLVAGGGAIGNDGNSSMWGGGGAGGAKTESGQPLALQSYPISIGSGAGRGSSGGSSSFYGQANVIASRQSVASRAPAA